MNCMGKDNTDAKKGITGAGRVSDLYVIKNL